MKRLFILILILTACRAGASAQDRSFAIKKAGQGRPVIFIHGLYCSGGIWDDAVAHYRNRFESHVVTLPGFAGQPPVQAPHLLKRAADELALYIRQQGLKKPVIIGHSLGGWLALQLAIAYPDAVGDLVCVSTAPFIPVLSFNTAQLSVDSAAKIGRQMQKGLALQTPALVRRNQPYILRMLMRDSARIAQVVEMAASSDAATQGQVMYELFSTDLRPQLGNIKSRILMLNDWVGAREFGATHQRVYDNVQQQCSLARQVTIAVSDTARHFIMFDDPAWFYGQVDRFLAGK